MAIATPLWGPLGDRGGHRDLGLAGVAAEDIARKGAEAAADGAGVIGPDAERLGGAQPLRVAMHPGEAPMGRRQSAPGVRAVHDVVMHQGEDVQQLHHDLF